MKLPYEIVPTTIFRETESVSFYDCTVPNTNGCDVVRHGAFASSPPFDGPFPQFYVHSEQVDNNLCVSGFRIFYLIDIYGENPYHIVTLSPSVGSLRIPKGVYHRSISLEEGSVLINQSERTPEFDVTKEFVPVSTGSNLLLYDIIDRYEPIINDLAKIWNK
ncbi:hypothetical protein SCRM01_208 [Synechococcus phage S-CRM01]|uniref:hemagglutinin n=1 Tax=Synechococcus phage S-CRM01 TaxID=1026955 RepID=UPI000209E421|nr:hemagglutinin [Synechococcus phage S-CRM01]AEC53154.1 hypothetical protein SCRM01_208 [Synechococcus phage S-CRM01]